jgi:hypothetical protein
LLQFSRNFDISRHFLYQYQYQHQHQQNHHHQQQDIVTGGAILDSIPLDESSSFSNLQLFVSSFPGDEEADNVNGFTELQSTLIRSLKFFWPRDKLDIVVVLDDTVYNDEVGRDNMTSLVTSLFRDNVRNKVQVKYNPRSNTTVYGTGWFLQQLVMFWADNFTDSEYIGFLDDDAIFSKAVQPYDLFDKMGRPRVLARYHT